jgi:hypothetical protein
LSRKKHIANNAKRTSFSLTPAVELAIDTIKALRRNRNDQRFTPNEILSDAIWKWLLDVEGKKREDIEAIFPPLPVQEVSPSKIAQMPKPKKKT